MARPPAAAIPFAISCPAASLMSINVTAAPWRANSSAAARPIPDAAPVTSATLPASKLPRIFSLASMEVPRYPVPSTARNPGMPAALILRRETPLYTSRGVQPMGMPKAEFESKIECAWTLASRFYTDPAILEQEKRKIFCRSWQMAGRADRLSGPGSYFTTEVTGEPIIVVCDLEGHLRAFSNVCRHRAGPVAEGSGCRKNFQCGYHGWTYTLEGRLIGSPDVDGMEFFDRSEFSLVSLRLETWGPFLFVSFDASAPPLSAYLEEASGPEFAGSVSSMKLVERRDYTVECNWKVYVDNYLEGYHIPIAHPALMREIDYGSYHTTTRRYSSRQHAPMRS